MALIKLGTGIVEITGKCGGNTFKRDASGQHIIGKRRVIHRQDIHHSMTRSQAMSALSAAAAAMIVAGHLAKWVAFAAKWLWKNKQGIWIRLTWWNWYMHFNLTRMQLGYPLLEEPPNSPGEGWPA